jgi:hypothetical protein
MAVEAAHECGTVRHDRVELATIRHTAGERHVQPAPAEHPGGRAIGGGMRRDGLLDRSDGAEPEQVDPVELVGTLAHVDVSVVEARDDQAAARLDGLGPRSTPVAEGVIAASDPGDPSASHGDRVVCPGLRAADEEAAAEDQQVGGIAHQVTGDGRRPPVAPGRPPVRP